MVTVDYIARSAANAYRELGTTIAAATLMHLGLPLPPVMARARRHGVPMDGTLLMECFANGESPMDADTA